jgi:glycosyltransferase involved in cell wall biosynthesis
MRLLHLNAGNLYGGIESYLVTLAQLARTESTFEHVFLLTSEGRLSKELQSCYADVRFAGPTRLSRPWTVVSARRALLRVIDSIRPDVIIAHGPWPLAVFAPRRAAGRIPVILYLHVHDSGGWLDRVARRIQIDGIIANSNFTAETARQAWPLVPVWLCRYPVRAPSKFDRTAVRGELGLGSREIGILQVSRFQEWKGQLLHVEALKRLPLEPPWRAFFVGGVSRQSEAELRERILDRGRSLPAGRLTLLGERADVPRLMQGADIFCQPNTGPEPFGIVFIEALLAGLPVVTTRMGGALEIVDETCGLLCAPEPGQVAGALERLVVDENLRRSLGSKGPTRARELCGETAALEELKRALQASRDAPQPSPRRVLWA